ncbi:hypothetical protein BC941DRAFT_405738 [Chlamydoabsidia padenii]|nr:hypothetical protein BC941DRAFT_405738 [Chlamydoabsidia padenii]
MRHEQSKVINSLDWNDTLSSHYQHKTPKQQQGKKQHYNTLFSDDDDDDPPPPQPWSTDPVPFGFPFAPSNPVNHNSYVDPLLNSATYHVHQAENALSTLKHVILQDGWKKVLKHKSGVVVHMMNGLYKADKTPIFKGEAVIHGFSPQSIFFVIGMRKLWDEQYEDGNLVENLNDTTSLTYEVTKPTTTSKSRDFSLVERIECTQNGSIIFVATSVESSKLPRVRGRTRAQIKLQGWTLEPIHSTGPPSTKVTFVLQENMKGWVPGFAKKSLARRPLVIARINDYLQKKAERSRTSSKPTLAPLTRGYSRRPSVLTQPPDLPTPSMNSPSQHAILIGSHSSTLNKRITFANQDTFTNTYSMTTNDMDAFPTVPSITSPDHQQQQDQQYMNTTSVPREHAVLTTGQISSTLDSARLPTPPPPQKQQEQQKLYPTHRHARKKSVALANIKQLYMSSDDDWVLSEEKDGVRYYSNGDYSRADGTLVGNWTLEQICSITHSFGARKLWDSEFKHGDILERFSQKDYLQRWIMKNGSNYVVTSTIDSDPGVIYTAATSVDDTRFGSGASSLGLYGWIFTPVKSKPQQSVNITMICEGKNVDMTALHSLIHFVVTHGCPPYIRRVAGKVLFEELVMDRLIYSLNYVVKHETSHAYRTRRSNPEKHWCTDIRVHSSMYARGFDVRVFPVSGTRVEVSAHYIKVFTTSPELDGKQVSVTVHSSHTGNITCNGDMICTLGDVPTRQTPTDNTEDVPTNDTHSSLQQTSHAIGSETPLTIDTTDIEQKIPSDQPPSSTSGVQVPPGYTLVPQHLHQNNSIIIISDDLTFNGQQLAVMFMAMLLCYYTGKFACAC